jgi:hypothetical protein
VAGCGPALAHGLVLWAEVRDGEVHVEAYASDGTPLAAALLRVLDPAGAERLRARTDRAGALRFAAPGDADALCIRLEIDAAHRAQFELALRGAPSAPCAPALGASSSRPDAGLGR